MLEWEGEELIDDELFFVVIPSSMVATIIIGILIPLSVPNSGTDHDNALALKALKIGTVLGTERPKNIMHIPQNKRGVAANLM